MSKKANNRNNLIDQLDSRQLAIRRAEVAEDFDFSNTLRHPRSGPPTHLP
jgi:hypothetical protein